MGSLVPIGCLFARIQKGFKGKSSFVAVHQKQTGFVFPHVPAKRCGDILEFPTGVVRIVHVSNSHLGQSSEITKEKPQNQSPEAASKPAPPVPPACIADPKGSSLPPPPQRPHLLDISLPRQAMQWIRSSHMEVNRSVRSDVCIVLGKMYLQKEYIYIYVYTYVHVYIILHVMINKHLQTRKSSLLLSCHQT